MFPELPSEGSVSAFLAVGGSGVFGAVCFAMTFGVVAMRLVQFLGLVPRMALAGDRREEQSGGSGSEDRSQFHPGAGCSGSTADGKWQGGNG